MTQITFSLFFTGTEAERVQERSREGPFTHTHTDTHTQTHTHTDTHTHSRVQRLSCFASVAARLHRLIAASCPSASFLDLFCHKTAQVAKSRVRSLGLPKQESRAAHLPKQESGRGDVTEEERSQEHSCVWFQAKVEWADPSFLLVSPS